jgi:hypothetical protein
MGALTEREIFDCMADNFKSAAANCDKLAISAKKGMIYDALRRELKLIEGCCRQAAYWRGGDSRWLKLGLKMEECHKRAGDWLRGIKMPDGSRRMLRPGEHHPNFIKLAEVLRAGHKQSIDLRDKATGKVGPILPVVSKHYVPQRDTTPVGYTRSMGGVIIPDSVGAA